MAIGIAEHIATTYPVTSTPCVLMWRETINGYLAKSGTGPGWTRDEGAVHDHWKRYGKAVCGVLRSQYGFTIVAISRRIRDYVKQGQPPIRDKWRTDTFYHACIPNASNQTMGIVVFPANHDTDHPLIVKSLERRKQTTITTAENTRKAIDGASRIGHLSDERYDQMTDDMRDRILPVISDKAPLFNNQRSLPSE